MNHGCFYSPSQGRQPHRPRGHSDIRSEPARLSNRTGRNEFYWSRRLFSGVTVLWGRKCSDEEQNIKYEDDVYHMLW